MAAHERSVLMSERNVESDAGAATFLGRGNQCDAFAECLADWRAEFGVQDRGCMFELAILADGRGFAVAFRGGARNSQCSDGTLSQQRAEFLADFHQLR